MYDVAHNLFVMNYFIWVFGISTSISSVGSWCIRSRSMLWLTLLLASGRVLILCSFAWNQPNNGSEYAVRVGWTIFVSPGIWFALVFVTCFIIDCRNSRTRSAARDGTEFHNLQPRTYGASVQSAPANNASVQFPPPAHLGSERSSGEDSGWLARIFGDASVPLGTNRSRNVQGDSGWFARIVRGVRGVRGYSNTGGNGQGDPWSHGVPLGHEDGDYLLAPDDDEIDSGSDHGRTSFSSLGHQDYLYVRGQGPL